ncbi:MAG: zinc ribbon domain-containing protein, partial [Clostridia bacterium]|nr:zinc ribbon domain-containing protein [Clostridia bacterium]
CKTEFKTLGISITKFVIENISLPEEVEKALDERTTLGVLEDKMGTYTQKKAADAMQDAAQNPSGGNLAGMGVGLGAGLAMSEVFAGAITNAQNKPKAKAEKLTTCPKCNAEIKQGLKFCPECGNKMETQTKVCPDCNAEVKANAKFCPECGAKLTPAKKLCPKCGTEAKASAKFCPECGEKL